MAKKKSAKPVRSATRSTKTAPKTPRPDLEIPPAAAPAVPPAIEKGGARRDKAAGLTKKSSDADLVEWLKTSRGATINMNQWSKLPDAERANVRRWAIDLSNGKPSAMPLCMQQFDSNGGTRVGGVVRSEESNETYFVGMKFGRVSYEDTGSVPVIIPKGLLKADQAEKLLCNTRLKVLIELRPNDERKTLLKEPTKPRIEFEMDSKGYRSSKDGWHLSLKFGCGLDHLLDLGKFAGQEGRGELTRLGEIEGKAEGNGTGPHPDVEAGKDRPHGTPALETAAAARRDLKGQTKLALDDDAPRELDIMPQTRREHFVVRVEKFPDGKWRSGCWACLDVTKGGEPLREDSTPNANLPGQTTLEYAVIAAVERWIGTLQKLPETPQASAHIFSLQTYLGRLRAGETPEGLDKEFTEKFHGATTDADPSDDGSEDDEDADE